MMSKIEHIHGDSRVDFAKGLFDEGLCPGEWVARYGHEIGCWSLDEAEYSDLQLEQWVHNVSKFLREGNATRQELREKYLTPAEIRLVEAAELEF